MKVEGFNCVLKRIFFFFSSLANAQGIIWFSLGVDLSVPHFTHHFPFPFPIASLIGSRLDSGFSKYLHPTSSIIPGTPLSQLMPVTRGTHKVCGQTWGVLERGGCQLSEQSRDPIALY